MRVLYVDKKKLDFPITLSSNLVFDRGYVPHIYIRGRDDTLRALSGRLLGTSGENPFLIRLEQKVTLFSVTGTLFEARSRKMNRKKWFWRFLFVLLTVVLFFLLCRQYYQDYCEEDSGISWGLFGKYMLIFLLVLGYTLAIAFHQISFYSFPCGPIPEQLQIYKDFLKNSKAFSADTVARRLKDLEDFEHSFNK